ncbi:MAG: TonB C-terminal domain-containing protein [Verrucomicrobia bacterium]|nr:TonB C-terminal domain-containing protein [Verrucomicrobiota bacterium]MDE3099926.1 TonB C-terminal domain-containing protein [Verrucomicrobiota bacterium]
MVPQTQPRKKRNSSRVNLAISLSFHALLVLAILYFAAREGLLGRKVQQTISVRMVKEHKPPQNPKPPPPKVQPPREIPKPVLARARPRMQPPPQLTQPLVAPPSPVLPSFQFAGGKVVDTSSDPVQLYRGYMEYVLREQWNRPQNINDTNFVAEVAVHVNRAGDITRPVWIKGSGNPRWDASVRAVFQLVKSIGRPPPTNFPPRVTIRFDTMEETQPVF